MSFNLAGSKVSSATIGAEPNPSRTDKIRSSSRAVPRGGPDDPSAFALIVNFFPGALTKTALEKMFSPFGDILRVHPVRHKETKQCLGYAYVSYADFENTYSAVKHFNDVADRNPLNNDMKVQLSKRAFIHNQETSLVVTNLPGGFTDDLLLELLHEFGPVHGARIAHSGKGYARLTTPSKAKEALRALNGRILSESINSTSPSPILVKTQADVAAEKRRALHPGQSSAWRPCQTEAGNTSWRPQMDRNDSIQERRVSSMMRQWEKATKQVERHSPSLDQIFTSLEAVRSGK